MAFIASISRLPPNTRLGLFFLFLLAATSLLRAVQYLIDRIGSWRKENRVEQ